MVRTLTFMSRRWPVCVFSDESLPRSVLSLFHLSAYTHPHPQTTQDKAQITRTLIEAAQKAHTVQNLVLLSSAGCDYASRDAQPRLREFIDLEALAMQPTAKGEPDSESADAGHSTCMCIIRAGFYAENLLLYSKQAQGEGRLPIPVGDRHKFAPIALGDVAQLAAFVVTSEGPHGLADNVRSQVLVATGALLCY